jgi:hypothetical protein
MMSDGTPDHVRSAICPPREPSGLRIAPTTQPRMNHLSARSIMIGQNGSRAAAALRTSELLEAAAQHAVAVHGHEDSPQLRTELRMSLEHFQVHDLMKLLGDVDHEVN